jgi:hypothetical protein
VAAVPLGLPICSPRINDHNIQNLGQLLAWNWKPTTAKLAA